MSRDLRIAPRAAVAPPEAPSAKRSRGLVPVWILQLGFIAAHVPLALWIPKHSRLLALHAIAVLGLGLLAALLPRWPQLVACAVGYITGAEVFWRMKRAPYLPWEFGKYAVVLILAVALVRSWRVRHPALPLAYIALLVPSSMLTLASGTWFETRPILSFNLSGPMTLAASVLFFSGLRITPAQMRWVCVWLLAPIVAIATVAAYNLQAFLKTFAELEFFGASNEVASGGFGPNQVAAVLGLGIIVIVVYLVLGKNNIVVAGTMLALILFLVRQCLVTFSRGGTYMAVGGVAAASFYLMRDRRVRRNLITAGLLVVALAVIVIIPRLQTLTRGALQSRFENTSSTGRGLLISADLKTWSENPVLGIGPGLGGPNRLKYFRSPTAHTEYSRMVAEHGVLGLVAMVVLFVMAARCVLEKRTWREKGVAAAIITYSVLFLAVDGMRLAAAGFAFGLAHTNLLLLRRPVARPPVLRAAAPAARGGIR